MAVLVIFPKIFPKNKMEITINNIYNKQHKTIYIHTIVYRIFIFPFGNLEK